MYCWLHHYVLLVTPLCIIHHYVLFTTQIKNPLHHYLLMFLLFRVNFKDATDTKEYLQAYLSRVAKCYSELNLLINPEKTKYLLIGTRRQLQYLPTDMCLNFLGETIR
jgi:hypothetical protein